MSDADVDGIVLAAGRGERLGLGPKAWLVLGGRTLLERAVSTMRLVADRVTVGVALVDLERARTLCGTDAVVVAGGATHRETMAAAFCAGSAPWVLVHDVAHPFLTPDLAHRVLEAARAGSAAVLPSMKPRPPITCRRATRAHGSARPPPGSCAGRSAAGAPTLRASSTPSPAKMA